MLKKIETKSNNRQSKRLGIDPDEFHKMTQHDLWLYADEIIDTGAADEIVSVACEFDSELPYHMTKDTFFGKVRIEFSLCPLVHYPRNITLAVDERKILDNIKGEYDSFDIHKI